jgi:predicted flap endonuclease-1-like 5' DNA nuclease
VAEQAAHPSSEDNFRFVPSDRPGNAETSAALEAKADTIPIPDFAANAPVSAVLAAALPLPEIVMPAPTTAEPAPQVVEPVVTAEAVQSGETVPAESEPEPGPETAGTEALDEDAAMRAIEGGWTPRRSAPKRIVRAVEAPEGANEAVAAAARAVTAARRTAEAVVAEVAEVKVEAGRPAGLDAPRDGRKDDLTHIIGVLPVIETALNKLGIYHFDQVSELTDENIGWIEGHLGVPGRIARELWREQARELSAVLRPKRAAEK